MSTREDAKRLLQPRSTVFLVTAGDDGQSNVRAMMTVKCEGIKTIWMLTFKCSDKYRELSRNPQCLVYATDLDGTENYMEIRLWGAMELLDDAASRAETWRDDFLCYFPGGKDDPNLCVMKFTAASGILQTRSARDKFTL